MFCSVHVMLMCFKFSLRGLLSGRQNTHVWEEAPLALKTYQYCITRNKKLLLKHKAKLKSREERQYQVPEIRKTESEQRVGSKAKRPPESARTCTRRERGAHSACGRVSLQSKHLYIFKWLHLNA